jgi:hypothetical protein
MHSVVPTTTQLVNSAAELHHTTHALEIGHNGHLVIQFLVLQPNGLQVLWLLKQLETLICLVLLLPIQVKLVQLEVLALSASNNWVSGAPEPSTTSLMLPKLHTSTTILHLQIP